MSDKESANKIFVPFPELKDYGFPWSRVHIGDLVKRGEFPAPRQLSPNRIAWIHEELVTFAATRPVVRPADLPGDKGREEERAADRWARRAEARANARRVPPEEGAEGGKGTAARENGNSAAGRSHNGARVRLGG
jgi:hypothetical protein